MSDPVLDATQDAMIEHGPDGHTDGSGLIAGAALRAAVAQFATTNGDESEMPAWLVHRAFELENGWS